MAGEPSTTASPPQAGEQPPVQSGALQATATTAATPQTAIAAAPLEVDDNVDDTGAGDDDSFFGADSVSDDGTSLKSSIYKFRIENGRTYHSFKAGESSEYLFPNDDREKDRHDLQHNLILMTQGWKLYKCPAGEDGKPLKRVLDVGTGTGIWALELGDEHPETSVIGIDLSPIQPTMVSPNVQFYVDDLDQPWDFHTPFDLIYFRMMSGSVRNWPQWMRQAYDNLRPGGYIELFDVVMGHSTCDDDSLPKDSYLAKWDRLVLECSHKWGSPVDSVLKYKDYLAEVGFTNIVEHEYIWPSNSWPKDKHHKMIGFWCTQNLSDGMEAISLMPFTKILGWSVEEVQVLLAHARKELYDRKIHMYWKTRTVYAQKPE